MTKAASSLGQEAMTKVASLLGHEVMTILATNPKRARKTRLTRMTNVAPNMTSCVDHHPNPVVKLLPKKSQVLHVIVNISLDQSLEMVTTRNRKSTARSCIRSPTKDMSMTLKLLKMCHNMQECLIHASRCWGVQFTSQFLTVLVLMLFSIFNKVCLEPLLVVCICFTF